MTPFDDPRTLAQPGILEPTGPAGFSLEVDLAEGAAGDAVGALVDALPRGAVLGLGEPLVRACAREVPGLRAAETVSARATLVAAQHGAWVFFTCASASDAFDAADALIARVAPRLRVAELTTLFRYRSSHDLTGYEDGLANPVDDAAVAAALVASGPLAGSSFAYAQRFVHDRRAFLALAVQEQDAVIGRSKASGEELPDAPESAHVKRTEQEAPTPPAFLVRRSMPWGDAARGGLQFVAFAAEASRIEVHRRRMIGEGDGPPDALLRYTHAETGGYYWCPPIRRGHVDASWLGA